MIGTTVSHYKILEKIGEGGMGEVYLAEDLELGRNVALKFLPERTAADPDALARFKREAKAAAALNHPNIVTVHEIGRHEGRSFIAMAYIDGAPLRDELRKGIPVERALDIVGQACAGLDKAHRAGIVHRDIKPENLIIDADGRVKILDFGVATFEQSDGSSPDDSTGGTLYYMSPEQLRGEEADARSDVFALGALLYEMLAGKQPFKGEHREAIRYSILHEDPEPLARLNPRVTPELERIVAKAMAKDPRERYPSAAMLAGDLAAVSAGKTSAAPQFPLKRLLVPAALVLLAFVVLIIINPFKSDRAPEGVANTGGNTIAIMYFENLAQQGDPQRLGEIITNLLITDLSQSEDLRVLSSQRLYDILKQMGREGAKVIDRSTATEIARTAGARWMMLGSILQVEPHLVVTTQLVDVATGSIESSQKLTGSPGESVFDLVGRMTGDTRTELAVPVQLDVDRPRPVAEVTTTSLDAYRHYVEGLEYSRKQYDREASESFRKALAYDSTFAMAHYEYGWSAVAAGRIQEGIAAFNRAARYADHVSKKERLYIESARALFGGHTDEALAKIAQITEDYPNEKEAYFWLAVYYYFQGDDENALVNCRKVLELDPFHKETYNQMAYIYDRMGNFEKSIWAINQYIELVPEEANPYDTRGDLYAYNGDVENAIASYRKATQIKPDFYRAVEKTGNMYLYEGRYDLAEVEYRKLIASGQPATKSMGEYCLARVPVYQGRLRKGLAMLDSIITAGPAGAGFTQGYISSLVLRILVLSDLGQHDRAQSELRQFRDVIRRFVPVFSEVIELMVDYLTVYNGEYAEADSALRHFDSAPDTLDSSAKAMYYTTKGFLALRKDDPQTACRHLEIAINLDSESFYTRLQLSRAYIASGRTEEAISVLESILSRYDDDRLTMPVEAVRTHYLLGTAYEEAGRNEEAKNQYRAFVEIWKNADPELEEVSAARERLKALGAGI